MASPTVVAVASSTETGSETTHNMTVPSGSGGDLYAFIVCERENNSFTWPSGLGTWNVIQNIKPSNQAAGEFAYKADNGESGSIDITSSTSAESVMFCWRISGGGTPDSGQATGSSVSPNPPNVNVTDGPKDILAIAVCGGDGGTSDVLFPAGYGTTDAQNTGGGATATHGSRAHQAFSNVSSEDPGAFTGVDDDWVAATVLIPGAVPDATFEQEGFRWRNDDGSESAASWRQTQDVDDEVAKETNIRLRVLVDSTNDPDSVQRTLQVRRDDEAASEWRDV